MWRAIWEDAGNTTRYAEVTGDKAAVGHVGPRLQRSLPTIHDVRHSFATWLDLDGVPVDDVAKVMGHEQTSTTLNRYAHPSPAYVNRVCDVFADSKRLSADSGAESGAPEMREATDESVA